VLLQPNEELHFAVIADLSVRGIGLVLPVQLKCGTSLSLQLPLVWQCLPISHRAQVVQVDHHSDQGWIYGCRLAQPLSEEELSALT
jgi:hypothetical protein